MNSQLSVLKTIRHHDYTKSYFHHGASTGEHFVKYAPDPEGDTNWEALIHMFLVKYFPHMEKEGLATIHDHFLNDPDCTNLIGEYMGMKKERMDLPQNHFSDQAFEVLRLFHIEEKYFDYPGSSTYYFDKIKESTEEYYPNDVRKLGEPQVHLTEWLLPSLIF